jgi:N-acetylmuramic acid 6-phosphate etherase
MLIAETQESVDLCEGYLKSAGGVLNKALTALSSPKEKTVADSSAARSFHLCIDGGGTKCAADVTENTNLIVTDCISEERWL